MDVFLTCAQTNGSLFLSTITLICAAVCMCVDGKIKLKFTLFLHKDGETIIDNYHDFSDAIMYSHIKFSVVFYID